MSVGNPKYREEISVYHAAQLFGDSEKVRVRDGTDVETDYDGDFLANNLFEILCEEGRIGQPNLTVWSKGDEWDWFVDEDIAQGEDIKYEVDFEVKWDGAEEKTQYSVRGFLSEDDYNLDCCPDLERIDR